MLSYTQSSAGKMISEAIADIVGGRDCTVLGYGISNRPLVDWLVAHGARSVTVRDRRTFEKMEEDGDADRLNALGVPFVCGDGVSDTYLDGLSGDLIFRTPGIRPDLAPIAKAVGDGATLISEMELFLKFTPAPVVAITGSDGKTTTTTLTARILEAATRRTGRGRVFLGGNIGTPLLPRVEEIAADDIVVVELSSFQLMTMNGSCVPTRAAVTNISDNHLNWHTEMAEYVGAKTHLLGVEDAHPTLAVLNAQNDYTYGMGKDLPYPVVWFSGAPDLPTDWCPTCFSKTRGDAAVFETNGWIVCRTADGVRPILETARIRVPGRHNVENFMTAIALLCVPLKTAPALASAEDAAFVADTFTGVAHRLELVREHDGIRYINSSIDSSPTRTAAALHALQPQNGPPCRPIVICGGREKHTDFAPLAEVLCRMAKAVLLTGESRELIREAILSCPLYDAARLPVTVIADYQEGMRAACHIAQSGDTVLLSPACASFDAFRNFEERGEVFRKIANEMT